MYDTIQSDYLKEAFNAATSTGGGGAGGPRALDLGAGAGVSTEILYRAGYRTIAAVGEKCGRNRLSISLLPDQHHLFTLPLALTQNIDWSGAAWEQYVNQDGRCPDGVTFYELDDERFLDEWRASDRGRFDVIVFNFAVNEAKASLFARELLDERHGRLLAPINTSADYWNKQTYEVIDGKGNVLWSTGDVGAWSVQFQPDVTQDTVSAHANNSFICRDMLVTNPCLPNYSQCSGIWCAPFNGFKKKQ